MNDSVARAVFRSIIILRVVSEMLPDTNSLSFLFFLLTSAKNKSSDLVCFIFQLSNTLITHHFAQPLPVVTLQPSVINTPMVYVTIF